MALVVLLRGVNVGGHRTLRPTELAKELAGLDAVNIGAAGTFVIRRPLAAADRVGVLSRSRGIPIRENRATGLSFRLPWQV